MKNTRNLIVPLLAITITFTSCYTNRFSYKERKVINKNEDNDIMRLYVVSNPYDSIILHKKSKKIKANPQNKYLKKILKRLSATVADTTNPGVGIAAPQVGVNRRIILVQRFDRNEKKCTPYLNVRINKYSKTKVQGMEGCLSVPGKMGTVMRSDTITVEYDLPEGTHHVETVTGFTAVIFQHETDHLNGILYIERIDDKSLILDYKE